MLKKILIPVAILIIGAGGAALLFASRDAVETQSPEIPPPLVRATTVHPAKTRLTVQAQGTVAPRTESTLIAQVAGQIKTVSPAFANGGFFEKGELLLAIDPRDYSIAVAQAKVQVAQAELRLSREQEEADIAREEWQKMGKGQPTDLVLRKPQIAEARATLEAAKGALTKAELNLERTSIRAPYAGRVRTKNVDMGQYVGPGTPLGRIYAVDYAEVRLPIPDQDLAHLNLDFDFRGETETHQGPKVDLHANFAGKSHTWQGEIVRIEGEVDPRSRMIALVARVKNPYGKSDRTDRPPLAVGMFVSAQIHGKTLADAYSLPRAAMRLNNQVLIIKDNRLYYRDVAITKTTQDQVIVSKGLQPGEQICLSPLDMVVDGMRVRVQNADLAQSHQGGVE